MIIKSLNPSNFKQISESFSQIGWNKPISLFEQYYGEQRTLERSCLVAFEGEEFAGYVTLLNNSKYQDFALKQIPEISDLNVLPKFRKRGFGGALITKCEDLVRLDQGRKIKIIGLGVGLTKDYADAMRLYLKLGYNFDENGIAYGGSILSYGDKISIDDELNLYLIKIL